MKNHTCISGLHYAAELVQVSNVTNDALKVLLQ